MIAITNIKSLEALECSQGHKETKPVAISLLFDIKFSSSTLDTNPEQYLYLVSTVVQDIDGETVVRPSTA